MNFPPWGEFTSIFTIIRPYEDDIRLQIQKKHLDYYQVEEAIRGLLGYFPHPLNLLAINVYESSQGEHIDKLGKALDYFRDLKSRGEKHYTYAVQQLERATITIPDIDSIPEDNKAHLIQEIMEIMIGVDDVLAKRINQLRFDILNKTYSPIRAYTIDDIPNPAQHKAETIRGIARIIREEPKRMRDFVVDIRRSGAVDELFDAFREAALATRDTARGINDATRGLRDRGAIRETAVTIDEITKTVQKTAETVRVAAREVEEAEPITSETVRKTSRRLRRPPVHELTEMGPPGTTGRSTVERDTTGAASSVQPEQQPEAIIRALDETKDNARRAIEEIGRENLRNSQLYEQILKRYPFATFPSKVALEDVKPLRVIIKSRKLEPIQSNSISQASGKIEIIRKDEENIPVLVVVDPDNPHFEIQGKYHDTVIVPATNEDSKPVIFNLKAIKEGAAEIKLEFFQQGSYLGQLNLLTNVVSTKLQDDITSSQSIEQDFELIENMIRDPAGVTLIIFQTESSPKGKYDVIFNSEKYPFVPAGSISLEYEPQQKFHEIFKDIQNTNLSPSEIEDRIKEKGLNLYEELIPEKLKELYWKVRGDIKSIQVYSKEPWIPWEIIKPWRRLDDGEPEEDEFLCVRFTCSRWLIGIRKEKKEKISKAKVVVPADIKLESAIAERNWLTKFLDSRKIDVSVDSSSEEVKNTLKTEGYDLIHFSSHGKHSDGMPLYSIIELEDGGVIRPESIGGEATRFGKSHPIVFLNSCQSGAQGFSLTGIQSWVTKFLESGASAFIGTLWSVSDETALKFTQELYTELSKGVTMGEAVRNARKNSRKFGDPSWLAYEFYGQPNVRIAFSDIGDKSNVA